MNSSVGLLLDKAKCATGSDYATAAALKVQRQEVSDWRTGRKKCSPENVALLANVAGLKAEEWLVRAVIEKHEGTAKGDMLFKALGKALAATGAAIASSGASAHQIFSLDFIRCILLLNRRHHPPKAF